MEKKRKSEMDPEIAAIGAVHRALDGLPSDAQARVLNYVAGKLKVDLATAQGDQGSHQSRSQDAPGFAESQARGQTQGDIEDGLEGISPAGKKWMTRNSFQAQDVSKLFSLGGDEIDLIAKTIPGASTRERMHSVLLLMGIAAYLGSGVARFTHTQLKETCLHYKAYDSTNFASYVKSFSAELSGDKSTAYALTARGMASATDLVRTMLQSDRTGGVDAKS
jgi:hypothetical protein